MNSAHIVLGLIRGTYLSKGAQGGVLSYPTTDELPTGFNTGRYNWFQFGRILWKTGASAAYETHGAHDSQYIRLGVEWGHLGFPTSNQVAITGKQKNAFEFGRIYSTSSLVWPVLTETNSNHKLSEMSWPRITGTITPKSSSAGHGCISVSGSSFPPGKSVTVHATDSQGIKGGAAGAVVVASNGPFSTPRPRSARRT